MAHVTQPSPYPQGLMVVTDNFYTRHVLGEQVKRLSDEEVVMLGTVRFNNIDGINWPSVKTSLEEVNEGPHGTWQLCQMFRIPFQFPSRWGRKRAQGPAPDHSPAVAEINVRFKCI